MPLRRTTSAFDKPGGCRDEEELLGCSRLEEVKVGNAFCGLVFCRKRTVGRTASLALPMDALASGFEMGLQTVFPHIGTIFPFP